MSNEDHFTRNIGLPFKGNQHATHTKVAGKTKAQSKTTSDSSTPRASRSQTISTELNESQVTTIRELNTIIEQFCTKQITKAQALVLLTSKLFFDPSKDEPEKYHVLNQYISTIDVTELIVTESSE